MNDVQRSLNETIQKYELQQASRDYVELIARKEVVAPFVNELNNIGIKIASLTWWCHVNGVNPGCPHGMGGPWRGEDWFSEMCHWDELTFNRSDEVSVNNNQYTNYYFNVFPQEERFLGCIVPAFELDVPKDWAYAQAVRRVWHSPPLIDNQVGPFD